MAREDYSNSTLSIVRVLMTLFRATFIHYHCYTGSLVKVIRIYCVLFLLSHLLHWLCKMCVISFPRNSSVVVYICFCILGTSISVFNHVKPPPVYISPRTAPKLTIHFPLLVYTLGDVLMCFRVHAFSFNDTFPATFCTVCSQCTDGIMKLVHVHNLATAEWIGNKLCCCSDLFFLV